MTAMIFYPAAALILFFAYMVITSANPVHSALYLVLTMMGLAAAFFELNAQFVAGVQLIVYAGAVMVLFVMVLMLFDLSHELVVFTRGFISGALKVVSVALLAGLLVGTFLELPEHLVVNSEGHAQILADSANLTKELSVLLYSKYAFVFEILGVLLLVVAVGVVALSRVKGGTHARH